MEAAAHGRTSPFTVLTPVRRRRVAALRLILWLARTRGYGTRTLMDMRFLHAARFSLLRRDGRRFLLFESNFNGRWHSYVDAFAFVLGRGMKGVWGGDPAFPGVRPLTPFKRYIREHELPAEHFWIAYPDASARSVQDALRVSAAAAALDEATDPDDFERRWQAFLCELQSAL